jgi:radical S-adenosyl methionine domain-containing protein 2
MPNPLISVNFHLWKPCNLRCKFCYATFHDVPGHLSREDALRLVHALADAGCEKMTFVGGEPTLCPHLADLIRVAHTRRITTAIVTNGARLLPLLATSGEYIDWVGLSVDSASEQTQAALGRGEGDHVARSMLLADELHLRGIHVKLNTVVTALNWQEDLSALVRRIRPHRWKAFQVLQVGGQNDGVEPLLITAEQFAAFVRRHEHLAAEGLKLVGEDNDAMRGSYVMIDPLGRVFDNVDGRHSYSSSILQVGAETALRQVRFSLSRLMARGGIYDWKASAKGGNRGGK